MPVTSGCEQQSAPPLGPAFAQRRGLRVCMISYSFYEYDSRIQQYATALVERGDSVDVLALRSSRSPKSECLAGVRVYRIQDRKRDESGPLSYMCRVLKFFARASLTLLQMNLRAKYDLIHVHSVPDFLVFTALAPKLSGVPVILDVHDILPEFYASKFKISDKSLVFALLRGIEFASVKFADRVIVANDLWRDRIAQRNDCEKKCVAICNYPNGSLFHQRPQAKCNALRLLYPGSLNWHQGLDVAIRAFAGIMKDFPNAEFHIYGDGPQRSTLEALVRQLNAAGRICFHDLVPLEQIAEIMSQADLAVVPKRAVSRFGNEAASTKILQFMALGVPVIVSRTAIDSYYYDESIVTFAKPGGEQELGVAMASLLSSPERRRQQADRAAAYVEDKTWEHKKYVYLELVDSIRVFATKTQRAEKVYEAAGPTE